ncbi:MAG: IS5 family transposase, partial [Candidatus Sumerlaeota bacterium]|nr:IS5 family transposase [Candidatus Sumerlaeota bacterium]
MASAYTEGVGCTGYDPVVSLKLLLLEQFYQLSDGDAVWMAKDSLSFRAFLGINPSDCVPDDTTLVVFRRRLREAGLLDELFATVTIQLEQQGIGVRQGSIKIVDATLVEAAVHPPRKPKEGEPSPSPLDPDADFTVKKNKPYYGYKLHLAQDRETGLITSHVVTAASVSDTEMLGELVDGTESEVLADKGYDS